MTKLTLQEIITNEDKQLPLESEYKGFDIRVVRSIPLGTLCAYLTIDPKIAQKVFSEAVIHGGWTYSAAILNDGSLPECITDELEGGAYVPNSVTAKVILGVDFAHVGDIIPNITFTHEGLGSKDVYRDLDYALRELHRVVDDILINEAH